MCGSIYGPSSWGWVHFWKEKLDHPDRTLSLGRILRLGQKGKRHSTLSSTLKEKEHRQKDEVLEYLQFHVASNVMYQTPNLVWMRMAHCMEKKKLGIKQLLGVSWYKFKENNKGVAPN